MSSVQTFGKKKVREEAWVISRNCIDNVSRLPRLWLTSLLAEASSDLTGPPSPSSSRESSSNMDEGLGRELWRQEERGAIREGWENWKYRRMGG